MASVFERRADGEIWCTLHAADAEVVVLLAEGLAERLADEPTEGDAAFDRLFPRAYLDPTEEESAREWNSMVRPDLVAEKTASLARLAADLGAAAPAGPTDASVTARLDADDVEAWLMAFNDLRLDLGTRLGVDEERDMTATDPQDPDAAWWSVYRFLTWCQGLLVEVLLGDQGAEGGDGR